MTPPLRDRIATRMGTLFLDAEADRWAPENWPNKEGRVQQLFETLRKDGSAETDTAALELARLALEADADAQVFAFELGPVSRDRRGSA